MEALAIVLLAFFAFGSLSLLGGDAGVGMLLPWLGRSEHERRTVVAAVGPFFLANEVWLVALAGILIGAFPGLEHELLYEQRTAFIVLLVGWAVRDAGLWWRGRVGSPRWAAGCDALITAGSWTLALAMGAVLGTVLGSPLLAPPVALLFALHGAGFCRSRLTGVLLERVRFTRYWLTTTVLGALTAAAGMRLDLDAALAGPTTLQPVTVFALVMLPLLISGQILTRWAFRGRVAGPGYL